MGNRNAASAAAIGAIAAGLFTILITAKISGVTHAAWPLLMLAFVLAPIAGMISYAGTRRIQFASLTLLLRNRDRYVEAFSTVPNDRAVEGCRPLVQACRVLGRIDPEDVVAMRVEVQEGRVGMNVGWLRRLMEAQRAAVPISLGGAAKEGLCVVGVTAAVGDACPLQGLERAPARDVIRRFLDAPTGTVGAFNWFHAPVHGGDEVSVARLMTALPHLSLPAGKR